MLENAYNLMVNAFVIMPREVINQCVNKLYDMLKFIQFIFPGIIIIYYFFSFLSHKAQYFCVIKKGNNNCILFPTLSQEFI